MVRTRDLYRTLLSVAPKAVELCSRTMTDHGTWARIEETRLKLRLPCPWVVAQPEDAALQSDNAPDPAPVLQGVIRDSATDGLVCVEDTVLPGSKVR